MEVFAETGVDIQSFKIPHFRNLYQKVGMFGTPSLPGNIPSDDSFKGEQVRGFGFAHDGSVDNIVNFLHAPGFTQPLAANGFPNDATGDLLRADVARYLLAFDSNLAPIVGQQVTLTAANGAAVDARIDLLIDRAEALECELVVTTRQLGIERGYLYIPSTGKFVQSDHLRLPRTDTQLRLTALLRPLTYTCVPPGSGYRIGLDADLDGCYNATEVTAGFDPRDPSSTPPLCPLP